MAQNPSLRPEEAYAAIEDLVAKGVAPTHLAVRERVGGRGSPPVISRYINDWYRENGSALIAKVVATRKNKPAADLAAQMRQAGVEAAQIVSDAELERRAALDRREEQLQAAQHSLDVRERSLLEQSQKLADRELLLTELISELKADKASLSDQLQRSQGEVGLLHVDMHRAREAQARTQSDAEAAREGLLARIAALEIRVAELATSEAAAKHAADIACEKEKEALAALSEWNSSEHTRREAAAAALERAIDQSAVVAAGFQSTLDRLCADWRQREQALMAEAQDAVRELSAARAEIATLNARDELLTIVQANLASALADRDTAQATVRELVVSLKEISKLKANQTGSR